MFIPSTMLALILYIVYCLGTAYTVRMLWKLSRLNKSTGNTSVNQYRMDAWFNFVPLISVLNFLFFTLQNAYLQKKCHYTSSAEKKVNWPHYNRWSVGRFSDEDTHCIQDETKQLHYKNVGKYVTIIRRRKQNTYSFIYFYITINFSIVPFYIIYQWCQRCLRPWYG